MQWDWGEGPRLGDRRTSLWCAWLAWSRFRVVIPVLDKTVPTIAACLDSTFRAFGGVPTYCLTDNEKTVTTSQRLVSATQFREDETLAEIRGGQLGAQPKRGLTAFQGGLQIVVP